MRISVVNDSIFNVWHGFSPVSSLAVFHHTIQAIQPACFTNGQPVPVLLAEKSCPRLLS
jgi:hypothetical protein